MRIAIISAHSCPIGTLGTKDTGGMSVYIVEVARELAKMGYVVDAYTRAHNPEEPEVIELAENAQLIHLKVGEIAQLDKLLVYTHIPDFACELEAYRKENDLEYDLVFSHYWLSALAGEYFSRWWNVPHVTMFHTLAKVKNTFTVCHQDPDLRIFSEEELVKNMYRIIAPTEREKREMVCRYDADPDRIGIVPCGVNMDLFSPVDRQEAKRVTGLGSEKVILFAGRLDPMKGIPNLIKAMPYLKCKDDASLVIIGGESDKLGFDELQTLTRDLGIEGKVRFTGAVDQAKMPYYYSASDVCVMPSYYESFGMVSLEALSCGIPIVANDVGDLKNIIIEGETGYVIDGNEPQMLAEKIDLVLENGCASVDRIRESVEDYRWTNIARSLAGEFNQAIADFPVAVPCGTCLSYHNELEDSLNPTER